MSKVTGKTGAVQVSKENSLIQDSKEKVFVPKTKREITAGKVVHLHKQYKRRAALLKNSTPEARRIFLNAMLDATVSEKNAKENAKKRREKPEAE